MSNSSTACLFFCFKNSRHLTTIFFKKNTLKWFTNDRLFNRERDRVIKRAGELCLLLFWRRKNTFAVFFSASGKQGRKIVVAYGFIYKIITLVKINTAPLYFPPKR